MRIPHGKPGTLDGVRNDQTMKSTPGDARDNVEDGRRRLRLAMLWKHQQSIQQRRLLQPPGVHSYESKINTYK